MNGIRLNRPYAANTSIGQIWLTIRLVRVAVDHRKKIVHRVPALSPSSLYKVTDKITGERTGIVQFLN